MNEVRNMFVKYYLYCLNYINHKLTTIENQFRMLPGCLIESSAYWKQPNICYGNAPLPHPPLNSIHAAGLLQWILFVNSRCHSQMNLTK